MFKNRTKCLSVCLFAFISHLQGESLLDVFAFLVLLCWRDGKNEVEESSSMVTVLSSEISVL